MAAILGRWLRKEVGLEAADAREDDLADGVVFSEVLRRMSLNADAPRLEPAAAAEGRRKNLISLRPSLRAAGIRLSDAEVEGVANERRGVGLRVLLQLRQACEGMLPKEKPSRDEPARPSRAQRALEDPDLDYFRPLRGRAPPAQAAAHAHIKHFDDERRAWDETVKAEAAQYAAARDEDLRGMREARRKALAEEQDFRCGFDEELRKGWAANQRAFQAREQRELRFELTMAERRRLKKEYERLDAEREVKDGVRELAVIMRRLGMEGAEEEEEEGEEGDSGDDAPAGSAAPASDETPAELLARLGGRADEALAADKRGTELLMRRVRQERREREIAAREKQARRRKMAADQLTAAEGAKAAAARKALLADIRTRAQTARSRADAAWRAARREESQAAASARRAAEVAQARQQTFQAVWRDDAARAQAEREEDEANAGAQRASGYAAAAAAKARHKRAVATHVARECALDVADLAVEASERGRGAPLRPAHWRDLTAAFVAGTAPFDARSGAGGAGGDALAAEEGRLRRADAVRAFLAGQGALWGGGGDGGSATEGASPSDGPRFANSLHDAIGLCLRAVASCPLPGGAGAPASARAPAFPVVCVAGPRLSGKTTLARWIAEAQGWHVASPHLLVRAALSFYSSTPERPAAPAQAGDDGDEAEAGGGGGASGATPPSFLARVDPLAALATASEAERASFEHALWRIGLRAAAALELRLPPLARRHWHRWRELLREEEKAAAAAAAAAAEAEAGGKGKKGKDKGKGKGAPDAGGEEDEDEEQALVDEAEVGVTGRAAAVQRAWAALHAAEEVWALLGAQVAALRRASRRGECRGLVLDGCPPDGLIARQLEAWAGGPIADALPRGATASSFAAAAADPEWTLGQAGSLAPDDGAAAAGGEGEEAAVPPLRSFVDCVLMLRAADPCELAARADRLRFDTHTGLVVDAVAADEWSRQHEKEEEEEEEEGKEEEKAEGKEGEADEAEKGEEEGEGEEKEDAEPEGECSRFASLPACELPAAGDACTAALEAARAAGEDVAAAQEAGLSAAAALVEDRWLEGQARAATEARSLAAAMAGAGAEGEGEGEGGGEETPVAWFGRTGAVRAEVQTCCALPLPDATPRSVGADVEARGRGEGEGEEEEGEEGKEEQTTGDALLPGNAVVVSADGNDVWASAQEKLAVALAQAAGPGEEGEGEAKEGGDDQADKPARVPMAELVGRPKAGHVRNNALVGRVEGETERHAVQRRGKEMAAALQGALTAAAQRQASEMRRQRLRDSVVARWREAGSPRAEGPITGLLSGLSNARAPPPVPRELNDVARAQAVARWWWWAQDQWEASRDASCSSLADAAEAACSDADAWRQRALASLVRGRVTEASLSEVEARIRATLAHARTCAARGDDAAATEAGEEAVGEWEEAREELWDSATRAAEGADAAVEEVRRASWAARSLACADSALATLVEGAIARLGLNLRIQRRFFEAVSPPGSVSALATPEGGLEGVDASAKAEEGKGEEEESGEAEDVVAEGGVQAAPEAAPASAHAETRGDRAQRSPPPALLPELAAAFRRALAQVAAWVAEVAQRREEAALAWSARLQQAKTDAVSRAGREAAAEARAKHEEALAAARARVEEAEAAAQSKGKKGKGKEADEDEGGPTPAEALAALEAVDLDADAEQAQQAAETLAAQLPASATGPDPRPQLQCAMRECEAASALVWETARVGSRVVEAVEGEVEGVAAHVAAWRSRLLRDTAAVLDVLTQVVTDACAARQLPEEGLFLAAQATMSRGGGGAGAADDSRGPRHSAPPTAAGSAHAAARAMRSARTSGPGRGASANVMGKTTEFVADSALRVAVRRWSPFPEQAVSREAAFSLAPGQLLAVARALRRGAGSRRGTSESGSRGSGGGGSGFAARPDCVLPVRAAVDALDQVVATATREGELPVAWRALGRAQFEAASLRADRGDRRLLPWRLLVHGLARRPGAPPRPPLPALVATLRACLERDRQRTGFLDLPSFRAVPLWFEQGAAGEASAAAWGGPQELRVLKGVYWETWATEQGAMPYVDLLLHLCARPERGGGGPFALDGFLCALLLLRHVPEGVLRAERQAVRGGDGSGQVLAGMAALVAPGAGAEPLAPGTSLPRPAARAARYEQLARAATREDRPAGEALPGETWPEEAEARRRMQGPLMRRQQAARAARRAEDLGAYHPLPEHVCIGPPAGYAVGEEGMALAHAVDGSAARDATGATVEHALLGPRVPGSGPALAARAAQGVAEAAGEDEGEDEDEDEDAALAAARVAPDAWALPHELVGRDPAGLARAPSRRGRGGHLSRRASLRSVSREGSGLEGAEGAASPGAAAEAPDTADESARARALAQAWACALRHEVSGAWRTGIALDGLAGGARFPRLLIERALSVEVALGGVDIQRGINAAFELHGRAADEGLTFMEVVEAALAVDEEGVDPAARGALGALGEALHTPSLVDVDFVRALAEEAGTFDEGALRRKAFRRRGSTRSVV